MATRPKQVSAYHRRAPKREPYDVVLLVCEGQKTEPNYFNGLRLAFRLSSVNVRILPPPGQDPMSIVNFAISELDKDPEYDRAYCVFDRDGHANFDAALRAIADSKYGKGMRLFGVTSNPCFEIWLLLHYRYTTASYMPAGGRSACERLIADLRAHYPAYAKGRESVFGELGDLMPNALERAERLEKHNVDTNSWNPSTTVHRLVDYLSKLKDG